MMDQPSLGELVRAVQAFLENRAIPELSGHTAFHARVAANALAIVAREVEQGPAAEAAELAGMRDLLAADGDPLTLNRRLCADIRTGAVALDDPKLIQHARRLAIAKVRIDQPNYSGLKTALDSTARSRTAK